MSYVMDAEGQETVTFIGGTLDGEQHQPTYFTRYLFLPSGEKYERRPGTSIFDHVSEEDVA